MGIVGRAMELLLTVSSPTSSGPLRADVSVELDPFTSVGLLADALGDFLRRRRAADIGHDVALAVVGEGSPRRLDPDTSVFDAELVSGNEVRLLEASGEGRPRHDGRPPRLTPGEGSIALDITSGPEAGRTIVLGPGRHVVGRSPEADVVIDDPTMSRQHLTMVVSTGLSVVVHPNPDATNGTFLGTTLLTEPRPLPPEEGVFAGSSQLMLRAARTDTIGTRDRLGQIGYNRGPYRQPIVRERVLPELDPPPERPGQRRFSLIAVLVPLLAAVAIVFVLKRIEFLLLAGLSPLMMAANYFSEGRFSKRSFAAERDKFLAKVEQRAAEVDQALADERQERMTAAPDVLMLGRQAAGRLGRLWERHRGAADFLQVRIGLGSQPTKVRTSIRPGGDPELREAAVQRLAHHETLALVPVVASLDDAGITGLYGDPGQVRGLAASIALQAVVLHSPEDLVVAAAVPAAEEASWSWLKWLPHTRSATSPLEGPHLVHEAGTDDLLMRLIAVVNARAGHDRAGAWPRVLLLLHEDADADGARLAALLDVATRAGIVVVWVGREQHQLPRQCRAIVRCVSSVSGESQLRYTDPSVADQAFDVEGIPVTVADTIARSLAPIRDVSAASATTGIPRVVPLLDALRLPVPSGDVVARQWAVPKPYGLEATIGIGPDGPFSLDLVQQGPHTLIAGTSGAGKSELLQTLVLALAVRYPPEELNFLFIDYKGGAASAEFRSLPHNVGAVTDLDERLSLRALASLRAELRRRLELLEGRAKDLAGMRKVAPHDAPPSLVIVVDEFATLVKEIPDFVSGIVDVAQRGRSLGIHLVMATQRPTGAVNDNILANTNLRICLRVLEPADSVAVIGAKDAAYIPVPLRGRAFARTGPGPLSAFQCAWSGAPFEAEAQASPVVVRPFPFTAAEAPPRAAEPDEAVGRQRDGHRPVDGAAARRRRARR